MLRKTKGLLLVVMLVISAAAVAGNAEAAKITKQRPPVKTVQVKRTKKSSPISPYSQKVNAFLSDPRWRPGATYAASQKPRLSKYSCVGCCAYTADFVQYVFGKSSPRGGTPFTSISQIRAGDILVLSNPQHWIVVLSRKGNTLDTVEGNWMGKVVRSSKAYTINGSSLMREGKKFRTFSVGYHFQ